mmetsp:Transcript_52014/g.71389  ORF Transcript_52014/g.71389 Transcript_52014/m.71389 type:complete len:99 (-) Transcript_52014:615-911(-)
MEFDVMFLDADADEEENLPDLFDPEKVEKLSSPHCMLCLLVFKTLSFTMKKNCKRCGKMVCDSCSQAKRRLSKLEKKKQRVCDECDTLLSNYNFEKMY